MKTIKATILMLFAVGFLASCGDKDQGCQTCELTLAGVITMQEVCDDEDAYTITTTVDGIVSDTVVGVGGMSAYILGLETAGYTCE